MTEIYYADIAKFQPKEDEYYNKILSKGRYEAILKQGTIAGKRQSIAAGLLLREVLRRHNLDEKKTTYTLNAYGKRIYQDFDVNLSHSHTMVACAWSTNRVGIDIEKIRAYDTRIAKRFFSDEEARWIHQQRDPQKAFFLLWTQKESIAKQEGTGINPDFFTNRSILPKDIGDSYRLLEKELWIQYYEIKDFICCVCSNNENLKTSPVEIELEI